MSNSNSEDTKVKFDEIAAKRLTGKIESKISEAILQILSSEDMLIASTLGIDVEDLIVTVSKRKIEELVRG